jgi:hypothetical protein
VESSSTLPVRVTADRLHAPSHPCASRR